MSFQDMFKQFKRAAARYGLFFFTSIFRYTPYGVVRAITDILATIGFTFTIRLKRVARESLAIAFNNEKTEEEINQIIKRCFKNLGQNIIELVYFMEHPHMIKEKVTIEGKEILEKAHAEGNGVIIVSAHFGNFPLMLLRFAQEGYKTNAIIRKVRDEAVEKYSEDKRSSLGLNTIYSHPRQICVTQSIKALRNNELLFVPLDQNFGSGGGVFVDFFGQKAATATGPVVFSRRTKAPIIPMFIIREKDDQYKIIIEPPLRLEEIEDEKEMVAMNIAKITKFIEGYIRKYPHEWGWMHRRWKTKTYVS